MLKALLIAILALGCANNQVQVQANQQEDNDSWSVQLEDWRHGRIQMNILSSFSNRWLDAMHISQYDRARMLGKVIRLEAEKNQAQSKAKIAQAVAFDNKSYRDGKNMQKAYKFCDEDCKESA